jgi:hypothetical protein
MERLPVELFFVLGFIALVLFNYLTQRAARRRAQQEKAQAAPVPPPIEEETPEELWGRSAATPAPAPAPGLVPRAASPPPPRLHPVRALLKDKRDLRRAVVLVMVLGPCRAQEPSGS